MLKWNGLMFSVALLSTISLVGCGSSTDKPTDGKDKPAVDGNEKPTADQSNKSNVKHKLVGVWHGSVQINQAALDNRLAGIDDQESKDLFQDQIETMKGMKLNMEFQADGSMLATSSANVGGQDFTDEGNGTWKLVKEDGNRVTFETVESQEDGSPGPAEIQDVTFTSDDVMTMEPPVNPAMQGIFLFRFERQK